MAKPRRYNRRLNFSGQNTGKIVLSAIKKLMKNTGWTARTIVKFIKMEYLLNDPHLSRKVSRALKRGVILGLLQTDRGRYRLNDMSTLARSVAGKDSDTRMRHKEFPLRLCSRSTISRKRKTHN